MKNEELIRNVRDAIAADTSRFNMTHWRSGSPGEELGPDCGTSGCIAGHIVFQAAGMGLIKGQTFGDMSILVEDEGGFKREEAISAVATELVGTEFRQLFYVDAWPKHYRDKTDGADKTSEWNTELVDKAAIELLDDILDGLTIWDKARGEWVYLPDDVVLEDDDDER